jgi:hypothetical protein
MAAPIYYSADMVRALPDDGNRYETVRGELLVTPAPRADHQHVVLELAARLRDYLRSHPVGQVFLSPADIEGKAVEVWTPQATLADHRAPPSRVAACGSGRAVLDTGR